VADELSDELLMEIERRGERLLTADASAYDYVNARRDIAQLVKGIRRLRAERAEHQPNNAATTKLSVG
jgi:hypothetical protein